MLRALLLASALISGFEMGGFNMAARAQDVQQGAPQGNAAAGKQLYLSTGCFYCHGRSGQGGAYNRDAPSLAKTIVPYLGFKQQLRNPSGDMPAYAEMVMSEKDLADIYAFLQALPGRRDVKDFTILND
jgi:mono/diheme cytochrome c family protein